MVDLRECKPGDKLISRNGLELTYVRALSENNYMDHEVQYPDEPPYSGGWGTRTHDGRVFRRNILPEDHDIVKIIKT